MPLTFANDGDEPLNLGYTLEDASEEEEVDFEAAFEEAEDEMNEERSVISASEYELDAGELPERLLFDNQVVCHFHAQVRPRQVPLGLRMSGYRLYM
jgi:hypothetical protein